MIMEGQVGPRQSLGPGSENTIRTGATGEVIVAQGHGVYHEAVSRGNAFASANQTGVTTQAGLSGTTPALTLYNPAGSGVLASVLWISVTFTVAFAAAAAIFLAANTNIAAAAVTGTAATVRN